MEELKQNQPLEESVSAELTAPVEISSQPTEVVSKSNYFIAQIYVVTIIFSIMIVVTSGFFRKSSEASVDASQKKAQEIIRAGMSSGGSSSSSGEERGIPAILRNDDSSVVVSIQTAGRTLIAGEKVSVDWTVNRPELVSKYASGEISAFVYLENVDTGRRTLVGELYPPKGARLEMTIPSAETGYYKVSVHLYEKSNPGEVATGQSLTFQIQND